MAAPPPQRTLQCAHMGDGLQLREKQVSPGLWGLQAVAGPRTQQVGVLYVPGAGIWGRSTGLFLREPGAGAELKRASETPCQLEGRADTQPPGPLGVPGEL